MKFPKEKLINIKFFLQFLVLLLLAHSVQALADTVVSIWDTNWNQLTLNQSNSVVDGTYTYDEGKITGTLTKTSDGLVLTGWWKEAGNSKECGPENSWSGPLVILFNAELNKLSGDWSYCSTSPESLNMTGSGWTGTLISGKLDISNISDVSDASEFTLNIDDSNIDIFLPTPTYTNTYNPLKRSYQPFGRDSTLDMESSSLYAGTGSVRVQKLKIDGIDYWVDLLIDTEREYLPIIVSNIGTGLPPNKFPHWNPGFDDVNFDLTSIDIFGPPARIKFFNIAVSGRLYDIDFINNNTGQFIINNIQEKGYIHYLPNKENAQVIIGSSSAVPPTYTGVDNLNFSGVYFQDPIAFTGWDGSNGEQDILINYASGQQVQTMIARDGLLLGSYAPPSNNLLNKTLIDQPKQQRKSIISTFSSWFKRATQEEVIDKCIADKINMHIGFASDNQLSEQIVDMIFTIAGSDALALSSPSLEKIRSTMADSKDVVLEMMANGNIDSATLGVFVSSTILKNSSPEDQQKIINKIWENNIPDYAKTAASASGSVVESNYKLAAQALAEGLTSNLFPVYTAAVKTVIQSAKYTKDILSDQAFQNLYQVYKRSNGNWDDVTTLSVLSINKFADSKVRAILTAQKALREEKTQADKNYNDELINQYLKNKMEQLYAHEQGAAQYGAKMEQLKQNFMELSSEQKDHMKKLMGINISQCDIFNKYIDYITRAEADIKNSIRNCQSLAPTKSDIRNEAIILSNHWLRAGSIKDNKVIYQKAKLNWLKSWQCLNYKTENTTSSSSGRWELSDTIVFNPQDISSKCYQRVHSTSSGNYTLTTSISAHLCNWKFSESITFTGTWTPPPSVLIPGKKYPMSNSITRSNAIEQFGAHDFTYIYMDNYETRCGASTGSKVKISTDDVSVGWRASDPDTSSWSGNFMAPDLGYAGSNGSKKFQIKAGGFYGCVRYIYQWK